VRTLRSFFIRNKHRLTLLENGEHICPWTAIIVIVIGIARKKGRGIWRGREIQGGQSKFIWGPSAACEKGKAKLAGDAWSAT